MTSQLRSKVRFFYYLASLALPGKVIVSSWNKTDETEWIVSGALPCTLLRVWWPHVKSIFCEVTMPEEVKIGIWVCLERSIFWVRFSRKQPKNDPKIHFELPKSENTENRKNAEIALNNVKSYLKTLLAIEFTFSIALTGVDQTWTGQPCLISSDMLSCVNKRQFRSIQSWDMLMARSPI